MAGTDDEAVGHLAEKHGVSQDAVRTVLQALRSGRGMAQFSHPDFGGMSQWSPGMTMVGDMFNSSLKTKLDGLCTDLVAYLAEHPAPAAAGHQVSYRASAAQADWWPGDLGSPSAVGAQNDMRYAVFPAKARLVIDDGGRVQIYDTADHRISGAAQAQSTDRTLTFTSQNGLVRIDQLRQVDSASEQ